MLDTVSKKNNEPSEPKSVRSIVSVYVNDFFENSTIHGIKYLVGRERTLLEKFWWLVILCFCFYASQKLIGATWTKWEEDPVLLSFKQIPMHPWEIPFPAVTVCPEQKIDKDKYDLTEYLMSSSDLNEDDINTLMDVLYFCQNPKNVTNSNEHFINSSSLMFFKEIAPSKSNSILGCLWSLDYGIPHTHCMDIVSPTLTTEGICYTINMLDKNDLFTDLVHLPNNFMRHSTIKNWSMEHNYQINTNRTVYPKRADSVIDFLRIFTSQGINVDQTCSDQSSTKIFIHHPAELPTLSTTFVSLDFHDSYIIKLKPEVTVSEGLESYSTKRRKCFYSDERKLKFYKIYTETNCRMECMANISQQLCQCVPYYAPHDIQTGICGLSTYDCERGVKEMIYRFDAQNSPLIRSCNCLPSCASVVYNILPIYRYRENEPGTILLGYMDETFLAMERKELFGNVDFWANCGGILGLLTGFSVLSLVEIIYFLTLRWICNLWKLITQFWRLLESFL